MGPEDIISVHIKKANQHRHEIKAFKHILIGQLLTFRVQIE